MSRRPMKYRHSFHAGNFADVHKHVTLLALLAALKRKDKGFLYLDTHAGRGGYDLSTPAAEARRRRRALQRRAHCGARSCATTRGRSRACARPPGQRHVYPGSPLLAARELRAQDRAVFIELQGAEAHALEELLTALRAGGARGAARRARRRLRAAACPAAARRAARPRPSSIRRTRRAAATSSASARRSPTACGASPPGCSPPGTRSRTQRTSARLAGRLRARRCRRRCW